MNDLTDIFMPPSDDGDPAAELDRELATAGQVLTKLAEVEGIDLDSLPEQDVAELLTMIRGGEGMPVVETHAETQTKEASTQMSNENNELTYADVAVELAKVAAANEIDLNEVTREDYHEAFNALAEEMQDPNYFAKQAEDAEKLAEAEAIGRHMAQSFLDELETSTKEAGTRERALLALEGAGKKLKGMVHSAKSRAGGAAESVGKKLEKSDTLKGFRRKREVKDLYSGPKNPAHMDNAGRAKALGASRSKIRRQHGAAAIGAGGLLATGAVGGGAALANKMRDKKSFDEVFEQDALALAHGLLVENGLVENDDSIDFSKFAEFSGPEYDAAVEKRAWELLDEHGWLTEG